MRSRFSGQFSDERLLYFSRIHPMSLIIQRLGQVFGVGVVSILVFVGFSSFHILLASFLSFVVLGVYLAWIGIQYFGTHLVITSQRILASSRSGIFVFDRRELRLENLKETIMGKQHALEVILHFGTLYIRALDHEEEICFPGLPHPEQVRNYIAKLMDSFHAHGNVKEIGEFDSKYEKLKHQPQMRVNGGYMQKKLEEVKRNSR